MIDEKKKQNKKKQKNEAKNENMCLGKVWVFIRGSCWLHFYADCFGVLQFNGFCLPFTSLINDTIKFEFVFVAAKFFSYACRADYIWTESSS